MSKLLWKALLAAPVAGAALAVSGAAMAAESATDVNASLSQEPIQLAQITSVSELTDVSPSDWAFQALQSLVENYGCIQGYPDRTFRGSRPLTRYEFAAGLNACLDVMAVLISQSGISPDDLAAIRRLQEEFQAELATLRGRVDALEAETETLRAQQFSTTTKLQGQAVASVVVPFDSMTGQTSASIESRARLTFDSSFTGDDLLRIRLQGSSGNPALLNPFQGLATSAPAATDSATNTTTFDVEVDDFFYRFPVGDRVDVTLAVNSMSGDDWVTSTILSYASNSVADAGGPQFYDIGGQNFAANGVGGGVNIAFTDSIILDLGYSSGGDAYNPATGIFNGTQSVIAQLNFLPEGPLSAAFTYMQNNRSTNFTGGLPGKVNTYAGLVNLDLGDVFVGGHIASQSFVGGDDFSWTAGAGVNDFWVEGSQLGIYGGELPQLAGHTSNPFLLEGYYAIPVNRALTVTPALIYGSANNGAADTRGFWGVVRATFNF